MPTPTCPICSGSEHNYLFAIDSVLVHRCAGCSLVATTGEGRPATPPHPTDWAGYETEADAGDRYADTIVKLGGQGKVLLVSNEPHPLGKSLRAAKCEVVYARADELSGVTGVFNSVIFLYSLERAAAPDKAVETAYRLLLDGGVLFISTPAIDSFSARRLGRSWIHWRNKNHWYFSRATLQLLLEKQGFRHLWFESDRKIFGPDHIAQRLQEINLAFASRAARFIDWLWPPTLGNRFVRLTTSGTLVTALKMPARTGTKLSIIMPVFNEKATVAKTLSEVLAKELPGIAEREIVVVESNSKDGTRAIVRSFEGTKGLKIVYEEEPRGKGHAVRTGFLHATGDIILIQDADSEYDINDYDELLKPLLQWQQLFVLGSRHQGNWKMRKFTDQPAMALLFNCGQILFTSLMNTLYGQKMTDPFTMYKVFRRECLFGLDFECNRFDFDHELVIKLLLKGYQPYEVPVNYWSRSYSEGKKVTVFGDPPLWIRANFKFRFTNPFLSREESYASARRGLAKLRSAGRYTITSNRMLSFAPDARTTLHFEPGQPQIEMSPEAGKPPAVEEKAR